MKKIFIIAFALIVISLATTSAHASGLGVYLSSGFGDSDIETGPWWSVTDTHDSDLELLSGGLVFDTNLSKNRLFNYRMELGRGTYTWQDFPAGMETELNQTVMTHDFGFGILRNKAVRLWLGPEIRISRTNDEVDGIEYDMTGFGVGLALGLNINLPGSVTIGLKTSLMDQVMNGDFTYDDPVTGLTTDDISTDDYVTLVTAALIFRFGEGS
ncbi:MAG: hypothetical protein ABFS18_13535 [Thermodesulfobacteriota bacterium]